MREVARRDAEAQRFRELFFSPVAVSTLLGEVRLGQGNGVGVGSPTYGGCEVVCGEEMSNAGVESDLRLPIEQFAGTGDVEGFA